MLELFLDLLFPRSCVGCGREGSYLCQHCEGNIRLFSTSLPLPPSSSLDRLYAFAHYEGVIKDAIHRMKYKGEFAILFDLVPLLLPTLPKQFVTADCLTPVPLHRSRERERGFNQSEVLANTLGKSLHIPVRLLLRKTQKTTPQAQLKRKERLTNLTHAFSMCHSEGSLPSTVLLVDDVCTTGATLNECARVLKQAGARYVYALVLAHGD